MERVRCIALLSTLPLFAWAALVGCQSGSGTSSASDLAQDTYTSGEYAIFDFEDVLDATSDATLEEAAETDPEVCSGECFQPGHGFGPHAPLGPLGPRLRRPGSGNHLGGILRAVDLTEEQQEQVRELMDAHRECAKEPLASICETNRAILDAANEQRQAILDALESGEIDRQEAREQLWDLNEATREAIRENPDNQAAQEALCACRAVLLDGIRAILDEEQQVVWDEWIAGLQGPCVADEEEVA